jgi:uncharacterized C2H2 Zn-finger protein
VGKMTDIDEQPERDEWTCPRCGREFRSEDKLVEHEEGL